MLAFTMLTGVLFFLVLAILTFPRLGFARIYRVPTSGMSPAVKPGDWIYANSLPYGFHPPKRGEVIIFSTEGIAGIPQSSESPIFVQRLVGFPGEELSLRENHIYINGQLAEELRTFEYVPGITGYLDRDGAKTVVPENSYFVFGDNTKNSYDSRYWGGLPKANVKNRALMRIWPPARIGFL
jgi:signal peptidase I